MENEPGEKKRPGRSRGACVTNCLVAGRGRARSLFLLDCRSLALAARPLSGKGLQVIQAFEQINAESGDLEMWRTREIVDDESEDIWDYDKIPLAEARKIQDDFEVGEQVAEEVKLEDFGRRVVQTARQTLIQRIKDMEKELLYQKYKDQVGDLVGAEVYQMLKHEIILVDPEGNELSLPRTEQIPKDRYRKGDAVKAVISRVDMLNGTPKIVLSRTSPSSLL